MRELTQNETLHISGAVKSAASSISYALAEDMQVLISTSSKKNLSVNKAIRLFNGLFGTKIKYF